MYYVLTAYKEFFTSGFECQRNNFLPIIFGPRQPFERWRNMITINYEIVAAVNVKRKCNARML